jgi:hypothetical protein
VEAPLVARLRDQPHLRRAGRRVLHRSSFVGLPCFLPFIVSLWLSARSKRIRSAFAIERERRASSRPSRRAMKGLADDSKKKPTNPDDANERTETKPMNHQTNAPSRAGKRARPRRRARRSRRT